MYPTWLVNVLVYCFDYPTWLVNILGLPFLKVVYSWGLPLVLREGNYFEKGN